jgi:hypothetical protein
MPELHPDSYLLVTLDSCRYDTFESANVPNLKKIGRLWKAEAAAHFTYASHQAMFAGFTPGVASVKEPFVNPKFAKVFKLISGKIKAKGNEHIQLEGRNIVDGFRKRGYATLGTGAVSWFDKNTPAGQALTSAFHKFYYPGDYFFAREQAEWMMNELSRTKKPVFAFMNIGETHVPYWHCGAGWDPKENPCVPFSDKNDAEICRVRQKSCLEYVDPWLGPVLEQFRNVVLCGDHGDAWGEDGLWEHGIHHPAVREVPLLMRLTQ